MTMTLALADAPHLAVEATGAPLRSALRHLAPEVVSAAAKVESRNREVHLPPVSTYRWWARRTAAVNGALLDAYSNDVDGRLLVADMFAGGGVIPLAAVVRGHQVYAQDLNPWPATGLAAMLALPSADKLRRAANVLAEWAEKEVKSAYGTFFSDGSHALISHTFRVATAECTSCGVRARMFPHALVTLLVRKERGNPRAWLACRRGHVFLGDSSATLQCPSCDDVVNPKENYTPRRSITCECGHIDKLSDRAATWNWEVVLVERADSKRRELDLPTPEELELANSEAWAPGRRLGEIANGQETRVLRRHGFTAWDDLYPNRQRVLLERLLEKAAECDEDPAVARAVSMAVIGSTEMAGHMSRWDRFYLKSYEAMAGHRFNLTTLSVEPNVWGTQSSGRGTVLRRLNQLVKAAAWLHSRTGRDLAVEGPLGAMGPVIPMEDCDVRVVEGSSERILLPAGSVHLALTDPPYHDDVQYSELSAPLRAWARLAEADLSGEAVVNAATGQLAEDGAYEDLLARIFSEARRVLRADGHLIFSYANRSPDAWASVLAALQRAGLRAVGCEILHSENETDSAKRNVRACTLDLILDLVPAGSIPLEQHHPRVYEETPETDFLQKVSDFFLKVGELPHGWEERFKALLKESDFLA